MLVWLHFQVEKERRRWRRFGNALNEQEGESVTARALEEIPFDRVRQQKQTQEEKKQSLEQALQGHGRADKNAVIGK